MYNKFGLTYQVTFSHKYDNFIYLFVEELVLLLLLAFCAVLEIVGRERETGMASCRRARTSSACK